MATTPSRYLPSLLAAIIFMQMLDTTILNTALPQMAADLQQSPLNMQSAVIAYALTLALLMPLSGWLCDKFGTRKVIFVALLIFVLGSLLCALANGLPFLVFGRVIQGVGGAILMAAPRLVMVKSYQKNQILHIINYIIMPALIGPIVGPLLGGYLAEYVSWHWIFLINLPIGLVAAWATLLILPDFRSDEARIDFDKWGFMLFGGGAVGLSLAVELLPRPNARFQAAGLAVLALWSWWAYYRHAQKSANPLYQLDLFQIRTFRIGLLGNLVSRLGISSMPFLLPLLLQVGFGHSASVAGLALAPVAMAAMVVKPMVAPLMKRFGYRQVLRTNTIVIGLLMMSLALPAADTPIMGLIPQLFLLGACNSIQFSGMNSITIADLRDHQNSSGTSLMAVNQQLSVGFGIAVGATILQLFTEHMGATAIHAAFRYTLICMGTFTLLSSLIFARLHWRDGSNLIAQK